MLYTDALIRSTSWWKMYSITLLSALDGKALASGVYNNNNNKISNMLHTWVDQPQNGPVSTRGYRRRADSRMH